VSDSQNPYDTLDAALAAAATKERATIGLLQDADYEGGIDTVSKWAKDAVSSLVDAGGR
jgi:hypothetical protein